MTEIFKRNRFYFSLIALFVMLGGIYLSVAGKGDAIFYFSDRRSVPGDAFFKVVTLFGEAFLITAFDYLITSCQSLVMFATDTKCAFCWLMKSV